jgi:hypothetical protein
MTIQSQSTLPTDRKGKAAQVINPYTTATRATGQITEPFGDSRLVRCVLSADGYIRISTAATLASASDIPMFANVPEYFHVKVGQKISVSGATLTYTIGAQDDEKL